MVDKRARRDHFTRCGDCVLLYVQLEELSVAVGQSSGCAPPLCKKKLSRTPPPPPTRSPLAFVAPFVYAVTAILFSLVKPAESLALLVSFLKSGLSERQVIKYLSIFSCLGPAGESRALSPVWRSLIGYTVRLRSRPSGLYIGRFVARCGLDHG